MRLQALSIALALAACGDDASHVSLPHARSHGGPVLGTLDLVTITYADDPLAGLAERFDAAVPSSAWLRAVGDEYGVHGGAHLAAYRIPDAPHGVLDPGDLGALIADLIRSGRVPAPTADGTSPLYVLYLPAGRLAGACDQYLAYHDFFTAEQRFAFAVIPECYPPGSITNRTSAASHEIIEAATDPFGDGWYVDPDDHDDPYHYYQAEVADLCTRDEAVEDDFVYEASWSNAGADAWTVAPCRPARDLFRAVLADPDRVRDAAIGEAVTWDLEGFAAGPTEPWPLYARHGFAGDDRAANDAFAASARFSAPVIAPGAHVTIDAVVAATKPGTIVSINVWSHGTWTLLAVRAH